MMDRCSRLGLGRACSLSVGTVFTTEDLVLITDWQGSRPVTGKTWMAQKVVCLLVLPPQLEMSV